jgi:hypothetical protein
MYHRNKQKTLNQNTTTTTTNTTTQNMANPLSTASQNTSTTTNATTTQNNVLQTTKPADPVTPLMQAQREKEAKLKENQDLIQTAFNLHRQAIDERTLQKAYEAYESVTKLSGKENFTLVGIAYFHRAQIDCCRYRTLQTNRSKYMNDWKDNIRRCHQNLTDNNSFRDDCPLNIQQKTNLNKASAGISTFSSSGLDAPIDLNSIPNFVQKSSFIT